MYVLSESHAISVSYKDQVAETQKIQCYTFSSLTIGFCDEALLTISNTKSKYDVLGDDNLLMIDAQNTEYMIHYTRAKKTFAFDEYIIYLGMSENSFNWISPIEELQTGFIANLSYNGSRIGDLVSNEIKRLPQRSSFQIHKLGLNLYKDINLSSKIIYFYDIDLMYLKTRDYHQFNSSPNHNIRLKTGVKYKHKNLSVSLSGSLYKNNLIGYEDISFNQRSEHHFDSNFGLLNASIRYSF